MIKINKRKLMKNLPNLLSAYRIVLVPVLMLFFFIGGPVATWINVVLFAFACISDYLDGEIARSTGQSSIFGKFLDATADKILIGGVLMLLVAFDRITGFWIVPALIIFLREILVSGLREFLGQYNISVPISFMGKWKTAVQMAASGFLMAGEYGDALIPHALDIGLVILLAATVMTVMSGWNYLKAGLITLRELDNKKT
jgi:CDP-diacylglycerol--glycerol-3-phosphate 3-phosphatidyltransferase